MLLIECLLVAFERGFKPNQICLFFYIPNAQVTKLKVLLIDYPKPLRKPKSSSREHLQNKHVLLCKISRVLVCTCCIWSNSFMNFYEMYIHNCVEGFDHVLTKAQRTFED